jgi:hypothetical protein
MARMTVARGPLLPAARSTALNACVASTRHLSMFLTYALLCIAALAMTACGGGSQQVDLPAADTELVAKGKEIFRFDTFGDETQWTDALRLHEVIRTAVDPTTALSVGLKVDADALPPAVVEGIRNGSIPQRQRRDTRGCRANLQQPQIARHVGKLDRRTCAVSEVALTQLPNA